MRTKALSSRFETALITTRRKATPVGYGLGTGLLVYAKLNHQKTSFFNRNFSTMSELNGRESQKLLFTRLNNELRFTFSDKRLLPFDDYARMQRIAKESTVRRAKNNQTMSRYEGGVGTIDPRLLRIKSPRNQQYLTRSTLSSTLTKQRAYRRKHKERARLCGEQSNLDAGTETGLSPRQYHAPFFTKINTTASPVLSKFRTAILTRRTQTFIQRTAENVKASSIRKMYPEPYLSFKVPVWDKLREEDHPLTIFTNVLDTATVPTQPVRRHRSILQSRKAKIRSVRFNLPPREARVV